jgi:hypothetical protein
MLSGIAFDSLDNMVLGFRDRDGDQTGRYVESNPAQPGTNYEGVSAGDTLRAAINIPGNPAGGWTLENNASAGGITTAGAGNARGPGNGEYYYQGNFQGTHNHVSSGGVVQVPGFPDVVATVYDPIETQFIVRSGGIRWFNNTTGATDKAYLLYQTDQTGTFGKAEGLGSLVALGGTPPIELGNRVWKDTSATASRRRASLVWRG